MINEQRLELVKQRRAILRQAKELNPDDPQKQSLTREAKDLLDKINAFDDDDEPGFAVAKIGL